MKRIVLVGGGHSHVEVLRCFGLASPADVELVLVSPHRITPYSGMLPGLVAGHYTVEETHIDLERLARFAGASFVPTVATGLDPSARVLALADGASLEFDLASLDIGSMPATAGVAGAAAYATGVKPVDTFLRAWNGLMERARLGSLKRVVVVGGGAAAIEMLLAMQHRMAVMPAPRDAIQWQLVTDVDVLLPAHKEGTRRVFHRLLAARRIKVHLSSRAVRVEPGAVVMANGHRVAGDFILWATGAAASPQFAGSGLAVDDHGFIAVDETLRSSSHPHVFAAGDCATIVGHLRPKSGVYAVRQGPPLAANLRAAAAGRSLRRYVPQPHTLALITTGGRHAVATRDGWTLEGNWVWRWKDWIDRRFMRRYADLKD